MFSALKHFVGCWSILVALDGYFLGGFCTNTFDRTLSLVAPQLHQFGSYLSQYIQTFI
jgi:hypothetical protein